MKYYLIDYENVNAAGLEGIDEISSDSRVVLFYTKNSSKIDLSVFNLLRTTAAELAVIEVHHGKQALDIQLGSYVGFLIGTEPADTEYYIVSKDKGYRNIQDFWSDRHIVLCTSLREDSEIVDDPKPARSGSRSSRGGRNRSSAKSAGTDAKAGSSSAKAGQAEETSDKAEPAEKRSPEKSSGRKGIKTKAEKNTKREKHEKVDLDAAAHPAREQDVTAEVPAPAEQNAAQDAPAAKDDASEAKAPEAKASEVNAFAEAAALAAAMAAAKSEAGGESNAILRTEAKSAKKDPAKDEPKKSDSKSKKTDGKSKKTDGKPKTSELRNEVNTEIQKILSKEGFDGDTINATASFVSKNIGKDGYKQLIYRGIIKDHGQKKGLSIYRLIKGVL